MLLPRTTTTFPELRKSVHRVSPVGAELPLKVQLKAWRTAVPWKPLAKIAPPASVAELPEKVQLYILAQAVPPTEPSRYTAPPLPAAELFPKVQSTSRK